MSHYGQYLSQPSSWGQECSPERYQNITLSDYLTVVLPGDMDAAERLQGANIHHSHQEECYDFGKKEVIADGLEFSPLSIHSPYYHIDDTSNPYAKDEKLFLKTFQSTTSSHRKQKKN